MNDVTKEPVGRGEGEADGPDGGARHQSTADLAVARELVERGEETVDAEGDQCVHAGELVAFAEHRRYLRHTIAVLFYRRISRGSNVVLRSLLYQKVGYVQSLLSKFNIQSLSRPKHELKLHIWDTFVSETMCRGR